ncbi:MAG: alpha/beta hydrolase [Clostridia bacterium]
MKNIKKKIIITVSALVGLVAVCVVAFLIYASVYYKADENALLVLAENYNIEVIDEFTVLSPENSNNIGIIFYPGAKVESTAYLPLLDSLRDDGFTTVLVDMPFNFAFFGINKADEVYELVPEIETWYIMGHSLGGAMASSYAENNQDDITGLIVLGAYVYGDYPTENALTIYGTLNVQETDYDDNIVVIDGANHAQFGNYGEQKGDETATITWQEQQEITVNAIIEFTIN